jgi:hypothetical protein
LLVFFDKRPNHLPAQSLSLPNMNRNQIVYTVLGFIVAVGILYFLRTSYNFTETEKAAVEYHIKNPDEVTRVYLFDKYNKTIKLEKQEDGSWLVNDSNEADAKMVEILVYKTLPKIRKKGLVSNKQKDMILKNMSITGITTEVYTDGEEPEQRYVMGKATGDLKGSYIWKEGSDIAIVHIPGFDGFVNSRYTLDLDEWLSPTLFRLEKGQIAEVEVDHTADEKGSFKIVQTDTSLVITSMEGQPTNINAAALKSYMTNFTMLNMEGFVGSNYDALYDSLTQSTPLTSLKVKDTKGMLHTLDVHRRPASDRTHGLYDKDGNKLAHDPSRYYGISNKYNRVVLIQDYTFGKVLVRYEDFLLPNRS